MALQLEERMVSLSNVHLSGIWRIRVGLPTGHAPCKDWEIHTSAAHLVDDPTADLRALAQLPLAHPLRPLSPDILPLPLAQDWSYILIKPPMFSDRLSRPLNSTPTGMNREPRPAARLISSFFLLQKWFLIPPTYGVGLIRKGSRRPSGMNEVDAHLQ